MVVTKYSGGRPKAAVKRKVLLTAHATQMLKSRGIAKTTVTKALSTGTSKIDVKTGREVVRSGTLRLAVERKGNTTTVLTVVDANDLSA